MVNGPMVSKGLKFYLMHESKPCQHVMHESKLCQHGNTQYVRVLELGCIEVFASP